ncbi:MAG: hypothetical protein OH335_05180 [Candidatus Parvarchaeota archaeon]|nr:hypothetical protein [Candidatus Jingweiarchaeum tengchongense]MCW1306140.1 hypothetical protein [Candidatus Jingweiarchaeum tengchongense]
MKKFLIFAVVVGMIMLLTVNNLASSWAISESATWGIYHPQILRLNMEAQCHI